MKHPPAAGFSLIELLVVSAVMAIIIGGSIAGYVQFNEYQALVTTGRDIENMIKLAQNRARLRLVEHCNNTDADPNTDFQGYRAVVGASGSVSVHALCGAIAESDMSTTGGPVALYSPPINAALNFVGVPATFDFFTLQSRKTPEVSVSLIGVLTTRNAYAITVSAAGVISGEIVPLADLEEF